MRAFLSFIMRGRMQAITVTTLSLLLPPLGFIGGGIIGLATLRNGAREGGLVIAGSVLLAGTLTLLVFDNLYPVLIFTVVTGAPVLLLATVLRYTGSQGIALAVAGLLGAIAVIGIQVLTTDPVAWWREVLDEFLLQPIKNSDSDLQPETLARLSEMLDSLAPIMTGLPASVVLGSILTLFLARWWHALLDNPGGFGREFRVLRLDRRIAIVVLAVGLFAFFGDEATGGLATELLRLAVVLYMFQGLAVAHTLVAQQGAPTGLLVGLYVLLFLLTRLVADLLAIVGLMDSWFDFRQRWKRGF